MSNIANLSNYDAYNRINSLDVARNTKLYNLDDSSADKKTEPFADIMDAINKRIEAVKKGEYLSNKGLLKEASSTEVAIALTEAENHVREMKEVIEKLVGLYNEIMKMQL